MSKSMSKTYTNEELIHILFHDKRRLLIIDKLNEHFPSYWFCYGLTMCMYFGARPGDTSIYIKEKSSTDRPYLLCIISYDDFFIENYENILKIVLDKLPRFVERINYRRKYKNE